MFSTFSCNPEKNALEFIRPSAVSDSGRPQHSACDRCRSKKLRCSGQANGCTRCRTISVTCTYSASGPDGKPRKRGAAGKNAERSGTNAISSQPAPNPPHTNSIPRTQESGPRSEVVTDVEGDNAAGFEEDFSLADQMLQDLLPQYTSPSADNCMPSPNFNLGIDCNQDMLFPIDSTIDASLFTPDHDMLSLEFALHTPNATPPTPPPSSRGSLHQPENSKPQHDFSHTPTQSLTKTPSNQSSRHPSVSRQSHSPSLSRQSHSSATNIATTSSNPSQHCRCLRDGLVLLEEVENRITDLEISAMDSALAYHKSVLNGCLTIVQCHCEGNQEKGVLLAFIVDKLSTLCESVVEAYLDQVRQSKDRQPFHTPPHPHDAPDQSNRSWQHLYMGDYEIDSMVEWAPLIKSLICIQLKRQAQFVAKLKAFTNSFGGSQLTKLSQIEKRMRHMALELQDKQ